MTFTINQSGICGSGALISFYLNRKISIIYQDEGQRASLSYIHPSEMHHGASCTVPHSWAEHRHVGQNALSCQVEFQQFVPKCWGQSAAE